MGNKKAGCTERLSLEGTFSLARMPPRRGPGDVQGLRPLPLPLLEESTYSALYVTQTHRYECVGTPIHTTQHSLVKSADRARGPWLKPHPECRKRTRAPGWKAHPQGSTDVELWGQHSPGQIQMDVNTVFRGDPEKVSLC